MDVLFLKKCLGKLQYLRNNDIDSLICDVEDRDALNYLEANDLIINNNNGVYKITSIGENWLKGKIIEEKIESIEKENRLLRATEQSAEAANKSAECANEANKLASVSNSKSTTANRVAGLSASFSFLTLIYYLLVHLKLI